MAATYVTMAELRSALGIGSLYLDATIEEVAQAAQDLVDVMLWHNTAPVIATSLTNNVATIAIASTPVFNVGQTVTISSCGATYNGAYTITGLTSGEFWNTSIYQTGAFAWGNYSGLTQSGISYIQYAKTASNDLTHLVRPYGKAAAAEHGTAYASVPAVREASLMVAINIWQSRQAPGNGASSIDFGVPQPFKMGFALMATVRGLLAPYLAPSVMVG
jgi:hypothetical protein